MEKKAFKSYLLLLTYGIIITLGIMNIKYVLSGVSFILSAVTPFIIGLLLTFILNKPYKFFKDKVFGGLKKSKHPKLASALGVLFTYISLILFLALLGYIVVPALIDSANLLLKNIPEYSKNLTDFANAFMSKFKTNGIIFQQMQKLNDTVISSLSKLIAGVLPGAINTISSATSNFFDLIVGIVASIYFLTSKEMLYRQFKKLLVSFVDTKIYKKIVEVLDLSALTFENFIIGQLTDSLILAGLCFITMTIFKMPYAVLISIIIGITNIIPFFGPIIGTIPGIFILLMVDPMKAIYFVILIIVLQQFESNVIYPRLVGKLVGLPGLLVLFAVVVGGALFGVMGMVLGVPACAVLYVLLKERVNANLKEKNIKDF